METDHTSIWDRVMGTLHTKKKRRWTLLLVSGATIPLMLYASNHGGPSSINSATGMYEFVAGTVINPSEVNDNFSHLATLVNTPDYVSAITVTEDGKVGIGTNLPGTTLQVDGSITASETLSVAGVGPGSDHIQSNHWFMYQDSNEDFHLARNGWDPLLQISRDDNAIVFNTDASMQSFVIDGAGHVGIATSEPNELLQVGNAGNQYLYIQANSNGSIPSSGYGLKLGYNYSAGASEADFWNTYESSTMAFQFKQKTGPSSFRDIMTMNSDGNVGIGTSRPQALLHLRGGSPVLEIQNASGASDSGGILRFGHDQEGNETPIAEIRSLLSDGGTARAGHLAYSTSIEGALIERMRITSDGNVGIGTATPQARLHIESISDDGIRLTDGTTVGIAFVSSHLTNSFALGTQSSHPLTLGTNNNFSRIVVLANGNVGIGTTDPKGTLDVNGSIYQRGNKLHADYVFQPDYQLESIEAHAEFMWKEKHLTAVPAAQYDENGLEILEVGAHRMGMLEELEKAHVYIEQLNDRCKLLDDQVAKHQNALTVQQRELEDTKVRLARLEALLNAR